MRKTSLSYWDHQQFFFSGGAASLLTRHIVAASSGGAGLRAEVIAFPHPRPPVDHTAPQAGGRGLRDRAWNKSVSLEDRPSVTAFALTQPSPIPLSFKILSLIPGVQSLS